MYNHMTHLVDEGKAVHVVYLDFDTVSHTLLLETWLFMAWIGVLFTGQKRG